ncbi:unnamed protein product [Effrenium voratum]|nr:unnamed protein product [Effrenium voratum]
MFPEVGQPLVAMRAVPWQHEQREQRAPRRRGAGRRGGWKGKEETLEGLLALGPHPSQSAVFDACRPAGGFWKANPRAATTILTALAKRGLWDVSTKVFRFMKDLQMEINQFHFSSIISACEKRGKWEMALSLLDAMEEESVPPSEFSFNAAISACAKGGRAEVALDLLRAMETSCTPDCISYNAAVSACATASLWKNALGILQEMRPSTSPDVVTFASVLTACEKAKQWETALSIFRAMPDAHTAPDTICYSAIISACEKAQEWQRALAILQEMTTWMVAKDEICLNSAISACTQGAAWQHALGLSLQTTSSCPNGIIWGAIVRAMPEQEATEHTSRLRRQWQKCRHTDDQDLPDTSGEELVVLGHADGLAAFQKPFGVSSSSALQMLGHRLQRPLARASRLDGATSGVMPVALGNEASAAAQWLNFQFAACKVSKEYACLCLGEPLGEAGTEGLISGRLLPQKEEGLAQLRTIWSPSGKEAKTEYEVKELLQSPEGDALSLLRVKPLTGRTHQIRAHLAGIGRPLVGDHIYGSLTSWCPRLFLHCYRVTLRDLKNAPFRPMAPMPQELKDVLEVGLGNNLPEFGHTFLGRVTASIPCSQPRLKFKGHGQFSLLHRRRGARVATEPGLCIGSNQGPEISAPAAAQAAPGEYMVILDKSAGARLGIDVDHKDGETLLIEVVNEGLVFDWNNAPVNKEKVAVGDRIIEVNGISKDVLQLVDECKKNQVLTLKLRRGTS